MKNMLKKIGVIGIIIAMLAPFFEMPVVKAAETCSDHTVMQYYFLDVAYASAFENQYEGDGYKTYAIFQYTFPELNANQEIKILQTQLLNFNEDTSVNNSLTIDGFYGDVVRLYDSSDRKLSDSERIAGNYETKEKSNYKVVKVLHGKWAKKDESSSTSNWNNIPNDADKFRKVVIQNFTNGSVSLNAAQYSSSRYFSDYSYSVNDLVDYFTELTSDSNSNFIYESEGNKYFALGILRKFSNSDISTLNQKTFGKKCESGDGYCTGKVDVGNYYAFSESASGVVNSYSAFKKALADPDAIERDTNYYVLNANSSGIDINTGEQYYWPAVLNVEYEVCTNTSEEWTLKYDKNTNGDDDSVTNFPDPSSKKAKVGTPILVDEKTPTRNGYVFKGWNTEKDGSGDDYTGGQSFSSPKSADVKILFAQWGDASEGDQKKTGVVSYVIGFISVGIVASGIYLIAKKKNLFRQI